MSAGCRISLDSKPRAYWNRVLPKALTLCSVKTMNRGWAWEKIDI